MHNLLLLWQTVVTGWGPAVAWCLLELWQRGAIGEVTLLVSRSGLYCQNLSFFSLPFYLSWCNERYWLSLWALHYGNRSPQGQFGPVGSTAKTYHTELNPSLSKAVNLCVENRLVLGGNMANAWGLVFPGFLFSVNTSWLKFFMGEAENIDWNLKVWRLVLNNSGKWRKGPFTMIFVDVAVIQ